ncbi:MAG UNVERIFIED_CONTAM: hypothetical protein LVR18_37755 [Planctomycetaceae bacterium]|jgi:molybdopterin molybdotransferase
MISIAAAAELINSLIQPPRPEIVPLPNSLQRVLATDVTVPELYPAFTRSLMDGYALDSRVAVDSSSAKAISCFVTETLTAGEPAINPATFGKAVRIMTGASAPDRLRLRRPAGTGRPRPQSAGCRPHSLLSLSLFRLRARCRRPRKTG